MKTLSFEYMFLNLIQLQRINTLHLVQTEGYAITRMAFVSATRVIVVPTVISNRPSFFDFDAVGIVYVASRFALVSLYLCLGYDYTL